MYQGEEGGKRGNEGDKRNHYVLDACPVLSMLGTYNPHNNSVKKVIVFPSEIQGD